MPKLQFDPDKIPGLSGKVIVVTGATSGIGKETLLYLATHSPAQLIFTGRNNTTAEKVISSIEAETPDLKGKITFVKCDLSSLASVKDASKNILAQTSRLDILMCNAGVMAIPPALSTDGYEMQFATNHMGHALLIKLLLPTLLSTAQEPNSDVRIVITSSQAARPPLSPGILFDELRTSQDMFAGPMRRYGQSKLANILYASALAKHYPQITTTSVHPGIGNTGLQDSVSLHDRLIIKATTFWKLSPVNELAWSGLWAATAEKTKVENGAYYEPVGIKLPLNDMRGDEDLEKKLWEWTEKELEAWNL